jgi:vancomycin permeability regulator SanA
MDTKHGWENKPIGWEYLVQNIDNKKRHIHHHINNKLHNIDAIFVLAGGLKDHNTLNDWVIDRLDLAYDIYKNTKVKIICMGGGTYHKPSIINEYGYTVHESTVCADYLLELGIDSKDIYREWSSYDTIANGYFAFMNYVYPLGLKNILVITSEFHMERVKIIFNWINKMSLNINVQYSASQDLEEYDLKHRCDREKESIDRLKILINEINTLPQFTKWLYEEHNAYCTDTIIHKSGTQLIKNDTY